MDMIGKVRRMKMRDGVSISEISRKTGLSRNTVKKWLKAPAAMEPRYERAQKMGKLSAFEATLVAALKTDATGLGISGARRGRCLCRSRPKATGAATAR